MRRQLPRGDLVGFRCKGRDGQSDAVDPKQHFVAVNCRVVKRLFDHLVSDHENRLRTE
jgi:hypothetical protein